MVSTKKYVKGRNNFQKADIPPVKRKKEPANPPINTQSPIEGWKERLAIKGNEERQNYADSQRRKYKK